MARTTNLSLLLARNIKDSTEKVLYQASGPPYPHIRSVHLSPDGKWLSFLIDKEASNSLMVVPSTGGAVRELVSAKWPDVIVGVQGFAWMQDSKRILSSRGRGTQLALWSISLSGGTPQPTGLAVESLRHPTVRPDGRALAFTAGDWQTIRIQSIAMK